MHMHFNPIPILLCLSLGGGVEGCAPPRLYLDSDPPAFTGLSGDLQDDHVMHRLFKINLAVSVKSVIRWAFFLDQFGLMEPYLF